jgi:hypothetical protein
MNIVNTHVQTVGEVKTYELNYTRWLGTGPTGDPETIVSYSMEPVLVKGGNDTFDLSYRILNSTQLEYIVTSGTAPGTYDVKSTVTTSLGTVSVDTVRFRIS